MDVQSRLEELGFGTVEAIPDGSRKGAFVYRIRTANGWTYERFDSADDVSAWAVNHKPVKP